MKMRSLLLAVTIAALAASVAQAQVSNLDERLVPIASSPLLVTNISAGWQVPAWAPAAHQTAQQSLEVLPLYLQVQNTGQKPVFAYRFMITAYDAFGDYVDTIRASAVATLAPQETDYGKWSLRIRQPWLAATVVVYLEAVRYQDGGLWRIDPDSVAALVPSAAPGVRFQAWHIIPGEREILGQMYKDAG
jgi:hypothetical protein